LHRWPDRYQPPANREEIDLELAYRTGGCDPDSQYSLGRKGYEVAREFGCRVHAEEGSGLVDQLRFHVRRANFMAERSEEGEAHSPAEHEMVNPLAKRAKHT
jgi:hypothetical protein